MTTYNMIKPSDLKDDMTIIDVRTTIEHQAKHILRQHDNIPLDQLNPDKFMTENELGKKDPVYILCRSGNRAKQAADKFISDGYKNIYVIEGGIIDCEECGEPLSDTYNTNEEMISLERQTHIVAGLLVVCGILLGAFHHGIFYLLSFSIGLGLIYTGVTDDCKLASLISKAPWNKNLNSCEEKTDASNIQKPSNDKSSIKTHNIAANE